MGNTESKLTCLQLLKIKQDTPTNLLPFIHFITAYNNTKIKDKSDITTILKQWEITDLELEILDIRDHKNFICKVPQKISNQSLGVSVKICEHPYLLQMCVMDIVRDGVVYNAGIYEYEYILGVENVSLGSEDDFLSYLYANKGKATIIMVYNQYLGTLRRVEIKPRRDMLLGCELCSGILYTIKTGDLRMDWRCENERKEEYKQIGMKMKENENEEEKRMKELEKQNEFEKTQNEGENIEELEKTDDKQNEVEKQDNQNEYDKLNEVEKDDDKQNEKTQNEKQNEGDKQENNNNDFKINSDKTNSNNDICTAQIFEKEIILPLSDLQIKQKKDLKIISSDEDIAANEYLNKMEETCENMKVYDKDTENCKTEINILTQNYTQTKDNIYYVNSDEKKEILDPNSNSENSEFSDDSKEKNYVNLDNQKDNMETKISEQNLNKSNNVNEQQINEKNIQQNNNEENNYIGNLQNNNEITSDENLQQLTEKNNCIGSTQQNNEITSDENLQQINDENFNNVNQNRDVDFDNIDEIIESANIYNNQCTDDTPNFAIDDISPLTKILDTPEDESFELSNDIALINKTLIEDDNENSICKDLIDTSYNNYELSVENNNYDEKFESKNPFSDDDTEFSLNVAQENQQRNSVRFTTPSPNLEHFDNELLSARNKSMEKAHHDNAISDEKEREYVNVKDEFRSDPGPDDYL